jgi:hypothetical protein
MSRSEPYFDQSNRYIFDEFANRLGRAVKRDHNDSWRVLRPNDTGGDAGPHSSRLKEVTTL